ncbi:ATP-NAD kinase-like domain-containing protein [Halteromyces radiatus]|uniref:ATP-NAD kinase-like domain-containing protein n=1 Tax=Halteromyces radiatus TaxID=101107 RepID=UPI00221F21FE|nr:ATP-NAD kinase-like domain-containing protein [Halteromyces radiatus]KAI8093912.1 ATP-NAD kinase-like domain-containing protein [Halteromyces radiatus]
MTNINQLTVRHLDQLTTLIVQAQEIVIEQENNTSSYPIHCVYGIHPSPESETFTVQVYLSAATLQGHLSDSITNKSKSFGQHSLIFKVDAWTDQVEGFIQHMTNTVFPQQQQQQQRIQSRIYPFLNPTSGNQQATQHWKDIVQPMLQSAGFQTFSPIITTQADKVRQQAYSLGQQIIDNEEEEDALIVCLGGDGTLHDLFNGLLDVIDHQPTRAFRLGVIPAGSGNAFALSLNLDPQDIGQAVLRIIHGETRPFHLLDVDIGKLPKKKGDDDDWTHQVVFPQQEQRRRIFVVMSWGFHAQIVSKSRYLRYVMGNKRFSLVAMALLYFLQHYKGDVVMKQAQRYDQTARRFDDRQQDIELSEGGFTYFVVTKQASLEPGFNITPFASPFSQDMDVMCMRQATADQLKTVAGLAFQHGKHVDHPAVEYYKTSTLYLRIDQATDICLDGEIVPVKAKDVIRLQSIQDEKQKDAITVFV